MIRMPCLSLLFAVAAAAQEGAIPEPAPAAAADGRVPLFDGRTFQGWHPERTLDPEAVRALPDMEREQLRAEDAAAAAGHWRIVDGELRNDGKGPYLTTDADYGDAEFTLEYRTVARADSGIYLRGTPQVQIWDWTEAGGKWSLGADQGSGGLWNNERHARFPLVRADRPFGEWNALRIVQVGERTSVWLNGQLVVDWQVMENYWRRDRPLYARGPLQLQTHGGEIAFRNLTVRELDADAANELLASHGGDGFVPVFDGHSLAGFQGAVDDYEVVDGAIRCKPKHGGNLFTQERYGDFAVRLQFRLPPGGNNGLAIRYPGQGDAAYAAMEVQILDDAAAQYRDLKPWQYCGSVYGVVPCHRGYLRPAGVWNFAEVTVRGSHVTVALNGTAVVDADVAAVEQPPSGKPHAGRLRTEGHFGFCGHNDPVEFRAVAIRRL